MYTYVRIVRLEHNVVMRDNDVARRVVNFLKNELVN